jgi:uncharacterized membrane protein
MIYNLYASETKCRIYLSGCRRYDMNELSKKNDAHFLTETAFLVAIILLMKLTGLSSIPIGPLNMTLTMVPIAIGAMLSGPLVGCILGTVYGFTSLYDAVSGGSLMTGFFFQISPINTFILCVVTRAVVGACAGWIFRFLHKADPTKSICYFVTGLLTPVLNTVLFMGYIVLVFYNTEYIQERVASLGATNPIMFIVLLVGVQGLIEALTGAIIGGGVAKAVAKALGR